MPSIFLLKQTVVYTSHSRFVKRNKTWFEHQASDPSGPLYERQIMAGPFLVPLMHPHSLFFCAFHLYREIFPRDDIFKQLFVCADAFISSVLKPQRKGSIKMSHTQRQSCWAWGSVDGESPVTTCHSFHLLCCYQQQLSYRCKLLSYRG